MDRIAITTGLTESVRIERDNGLLNPTSFNQYFHDDYGYIKTGTTPGSINRLYYNSITLDKSEHVVIDLGDLPTEPGGIGSGGKISTLNGLSVIVTSNPSDLTITGKGVLLGDSSGGSHTNLMFGSNNVVVTIPRNPGFFVWASDEGVTLTGSKLKITNMDDENKTTVIIKIIGRS